ncbi:unnamed protein product [Blepharisma stoltei]|uniref:Uncharacterized protein n=1 Tax=Blepharisma stoltei TaxID=1481888 RepID=A0AAU9JLD4_9CILI|nr:unnamed protein product [Blepharisma stoltei]
MDSSSDEFQEDNDPSNEFETKLQESYQFHKESNSRPISSSSSNRPQTASRHRDDPDPRVAVFIIPPFQVYSKIANHLTAQGIPKSEVVSALGEFSTLEKFRNGFSTLGLELTEDEILVLFRDNGISKNGILRISEIYSKIINEVKEEEEDTSHHSQDNNPDQLRREAEKLLQATQPKLAKKLKQKSDRSLKRPVSGAIRSHGSSAKSFRPVSAYEGSKLSQTKPDRVIFKKNYLQETKSKQKEAEKELALTVDKCKREFEYESLHKMGEANEIAQSMGLPTIYRAIKKEDGTTKCHIYHNDQFVEEITLDNFLREWRRLKRKQKPAINMQPQAAAITTQPSVSENLMKSTQQPSAKVNKKERQEELKKLLLETKELTNKLKEQLKILEKKGIVSKSMHSSVAGFSSSLI